MGQSIKNLKAAILVAVSGFIVWTEVLPAYEFTSSLKLTAEERMQLLNSRQDLLKKVNDLGAEYDSRYSELQRMAFVVPDSKELPEVIAMVESIFSQTGNILGDYTIGNANTDEEGLKNISLTISAKGSYESFVNLIKTIEKNIRIFDIVYLSVSEDLQDISGGSLNIEIKGDIYWLKQGMN